MNNPTDPFDNKRARRGQFAIRITVVIMAILLAIYVVGNLWHLHDLRQEQPGATVTSTS